ncbi:MAG TPA: alkaline phosphatase family protein, partial [Terriglobales bacterium]|nr:alkaline phosphatase family protein [Terriglobales bacterium]
MRPAAHRLLSALLIFILIASIAPFKPAHASVYNARPKLIVVIVVDQFRGDYLERYRDQFGAGGFRMLRDKGANFTECYYDYANTHTAPGHATLFTGAYTSGHGIVGNDWYDPERKKFVSSVQDENFKLIGANGTGASPRNLLVTSLGDEMKLATGGKSRVFSVSLKDRSAILPGGRSADGAYWIEKDTGLFVTSSYYRNEMPAWAAEFNAQKKNEKYLNLEWKDAKGKVMRSTAPGQKDLDGTVLGFYDSVGRTPFANDYQLEFIRELIANEKLGAGPATDLLVISLSSYDILGHKVGPDSPELVAMTLALDKQLAEFFAYLGRQVGLANTWIALSADHGVAPMAETAAGYRIPSSRLDVAAFRRDLNTQLLTKTGGAKTANYIRGVKWPIISVA